MNLYLLLLMTFLICAWALWARRSPRRGRAETVAFAILCSLWLGLALRFGARTYPGLHFSNNAELNNLFNGGILFTTVGYLAVGIAFLTYIGMAITNVHGVLRTFLTILFLIAMLVAVLITIYGFYWAILLGRLA